MRPLISAFILAAVATTACESSMKSPDIKHTPHPRMRYEVTLTIADAPGSFETVNGNAYYEVTNKECSPEDPISGTWRHRPTARIPFTFARIADSTYTGTVYLDLLQDEDYFGLGLCRWELRTVGASLKADGTGFAPGISAAKLVTGQPETTYFANEIYQRPTVKGLSTAGVPLSDWIANQPGKFFSTILIAKERLE